MAAREEQFQELLNQGHSAAWDRDWKQAVEYYSQALDLSPDQPVALANLGLAYYELKEYDQALKIYMRYAKEVRDDPFPLEKLGEIYEKTGKPDQAARFALYAGEAYLKIKEINRAMENWVRTTRNAPENLQAHSRLALVHERLGQKQQAVREFLVVASLYQRQRDQENAVRAVEHALAQMPDSQEAQRAKEILKSGGLLPIPSAPRKVYTKEITQLQKKAGLEGESVATGGQNPIEETHAFALKTLAGLLFEEDEGEESQAERNSRRGIQSIVAGARSLVARPTDQTKIALHLGQALDLQTSGEVSQAAEDLERAINAGLSNSAAIFELGYLRAEEKRLESAIRVLQKVMHHQDYALATRLLLGQLYQKMDRIPEACMEYLQALRLADRETVSRQLAKDVDQLYEPVLEIIRKQNDPQSEAQICKNVEELLLHQDWREHLVQAREQLNAQADNGQIIPLTELVTQSGSGTLVESLSKIYQLAKAGYTRSAMEEAFFVLQFTPDYLPLHTYLGDLLLKQGQVEDAVNKYIVVARTYETRDEPERAIEVYHRLIELVPMSDTPRQRLIAQLVALGKENDAIAETINLANVYYQLADLKRARETYMQALDIASQNDLPAHKQVQILHLIADIDMQSLNWRKALQLFEQIRRITPDDDSARYRLIDLNMRLGQKEQAVSELDNYLAYLERNNKTRQAVAFLKKLDKENISWGDWLSPRINRFSS
jgi:tetratricopeptide (TPR) repeat protein